MKIGIKVGDVMTRNFVSARPEIPVLTAVKLMVKKRVGSLIIEENGLLKGILTEKDIMWALSKKQNLSHVKAGDICTKKIVTIRPGADIYDAILVMRRGKLRRLPVTIKQQVIGYLTLKDILRIQPELFEIAREGYNLKWPVQKEEGKEPEAVREGECDDCGNFDILYSKDGRLLCEDCRDMG